MIMLWICLVVALRIARGAAEEEHEQFVVVVASIDGDSIPLRLNTASLESDARAAVIRHRLSRPVAHCREGNASCVSAMIVEEARKMQQSTCSIVFERPRQLEVHVLGDVDMFLAFDQNGIRVPFRRGKIFLDAWYTSGETKWAAASWLDVHDGFASIRLEPPSRRAGGGGSSSTFRQTLRIAVSAFSPLCGGWIQGGRDVVYSPFGEPDPPKPTLQLEPKETGARGAFATLLYDDQQGYDRGAIALFQSLKETGTKHSFVALVGQGVGKETRAKLERMNVELVDTATSRTAGEPSSALPALGNGQWNKLQLWELPYDTVLYLDADSLVLRNVDVLIDGTNHAEFDLAAVNDYFAGAVLLVRPRRKDQANITDEFLKTLQDYGGRYVYGEQDFLNVHFSGRHELLPSEYHCLAEATAARYAENIAEASAEDSSSSLVPLLRAKCAILEFSSCARDGAPRAWKPWHGVGVLRADRRVCLYKPTPQFRALAAVWEDYYAKGTTSST